MDKKKDEEVDLNKIDQLKPENLTSRNLVNSLA
jgi:hypothetical protein